jgi:hypothetical protein
VPVNCANIGISDFSRAAFRPELPLLMRQPETRNPALPAMRKWFAERPHVVGTNYKHFRPRYMQQFEDVELPYEFFLPKHFNPKHATFENLGAEHVQLLRKIYSYLGESPQPGFHRFNAPFGLLLEAHDKEWPFPLYIAQARIADLPDELRDDLVTPKIVKFAGKGDVYDANVWLGTLDTYTPLHKDPNPNLFVQIVGDKKVRLYPPDVGMNIFQDVQKKIGGNSSATFRGDEMMDGPERRALEEAVWDDDSENNSYQASSFRADVNAGDSLFIPKGWWHSVKSVGSQAITVSANWWFR